MEGILRKTKIIATLGPATETAEDIRELLEAGASVLRLNMTHAKADWVREVAQAVRSVSEEAGIPAALLMDLTGPSIRTGELKEPIDLEPGDGMEITLGDATPAMACSTSVNYAGLGGDLAVGDLVLVDNGVIHLKVKAKDAERVTCEVIAGGELGSRRHINLPGIRVSLPGLSEKDLKDIELAGEVGVDFVAMSFVRDAAHLEELRGLLEKAGSHAEIIAKIEDQEAVKHLDQIVMASDGVMVARGDLGIEVHMEEMPIVQRIIVKRCHALGKKVIVATHLLESMIENPVPTRAEVTDVANAVYEQADALMLSGETSIGAHASACVRALDTIARRIEASGGAGYSEAARLDTRKKKTVRSAVALANSIANSSIVVFTDRGVLGNYVASMRPEKAPIFAFTGEETVYRHLLMNRGVEPFVMGISEARAVLVEQAAAVLRERGLVEAGDPLVVLIDVLEDEEKEKGAVDSIHLQTA
ncbi:MAG: pyruvate kinase [Verrucomicrobiota bacterium]